MSKENGKRLLKKSQEQKGVPDELWRHDKECVLVDMPEHLSDSIERTLCSKNPAKFFSQQLSAGLLDAPCL